MALALAWLVPSGAVRAQEAAAPVPAPALPVAVVDPPRRLPEVAFQDAGGARLDLGGFRGRVVLLNLWATWCGPCVLEMPSLDRLQGALADQPFRVVAVSLDRDGKRPVDAFYRRANLTALAKYFDPRARIPSDLSTTGLPLTLVIDHQGRQVGAFQGSVDWDRGEVKEYLRPFLDRARDCDCAAPLP
ncbi:TlpA family protein disulfide reductase [Methylobacterium nonmethylotrophicum]|nr:TlpA disulfide reductase family protein [Methylobacterium nonmethylotrophicum]